MKCLDDEVGRLTAENVAMREAIENALLSMQTQALMYDDPDRRRTWAKPDMKMVEAARILGAALAQASE